MFRILLLTSLLAASALVAVDCTGKPNNCPDAVDGCETIFPPKADGSPNDLCNNVGVASFAHECRKTCHSCCEIADSCQDNNVNCADWVHNHFCDSSYYTAQQKYDYCAKSCGMC